MAGLRSLLDAAHLAALGVWVGAVGMTAAVAAVIFPEMKELAPSVESFSAYPKDHWVIAAGRVMGRVFTILDWAQIACALLALVSAALLVVMKDARRWRRLFVTLAPAAALVWYALMVAQPMHADLAGFWDAARSGNVEAADAYRGAFDARHPVASDAMGAIMLLALGALMISAWRKNVATVKAKTQRESAS